MDLALAIWLERRENLSAAQRGGGGKGKDDAALKHREKNNNKRVKERTTRTLRQDGHRSVSGKECGCKRGKDLLLELLAVPSAGCALLCLTDSTLGICLI